MDLSFACEDDFRSRLLSEIPRLRRFALFLCRRADLADDLTQDTLATALEKRHTLRDGAALRPWLLSVMRNRHLNTLAVARTVPLDSHDVGIAPAAEACVAAAEAVRAMVALPEEQREALFLVVVEGYGYDEAAQLCGCSAGTIKSRVSRGRQAVLDSIEHGRTAERAAETRGRRAIPLAQAECVSGDVRVA